MIYFIAHLAYFSHLVFDKQVMNERTVSSIHVEFDDALTWRGQLVQVKIDSIQKVGALSLLIECGIIDGGVDVLVSREMILERIIIMITNGIRIKITDI